MDFDYEYILGLPFKGKKILLRVDINSNIDLETMQLKSAPRIKAIVPTLDALESAAVVILAHQGRFGDPDCIDLDIHAAFLAKELGRPVKFVRDIFGPEAIQAIQELQPGEILMLNNVREWEPENNEMSVEEAEQTELIMTLSPLFDYFVNDAFGGAHRAQPSMIGWPNIIAGPLVHRELATVKRLFYPARPSVWLVGGAKAPDKFKAIKYNLEADHIDKVLISGITCYLFLLAKGIDIGENNLAVLAKEAKDLDALRAQAEEVYQQYADKIVLPVDLAYDDDGTRVEIPVEELATLGRSTGDIGQQTIELFKEQIAAASTIIANGPPGIFEKATLRKGTDAIIEAMANAIDTGIFVEVGGGDMGEACLSSAFGYKFKFTSTAGGALLEILSGKELPLIKVLREKKPNIAC